LKLFRRIEPAINPEFEVGRFLTSHGYTRIPPLLGAMEYLRPGVDSGTLSVVQGLVQHQRSGWEFSIDELRRYYEPVAARVTRPDWRGGQDALAPPPAEPASPAPTPFFAAIENWYLTTAATLGRRTAELHLTLGAATSDPLFGHERFTSAALD